MAGRYTPTSLTRIPVSESVCKSFRITADTKSYGFSDPRKENRELLFTVDIVDMIFLLQKWESIEANHLVGDTICTEEISHSFCYK